MQYAQLGPTDLMVSRVAFGCMSLKGAGAASAGLLQQALDSGINFFDTADLYDKGANETLVGNAFKGVRHQVVLATKVGNQWRPDGSGWDWNPTKAYILQAVEESLRRLQTDYIDLYQLHGGTLEDPVEETIEAFQLLQEQGKIRYYGISSIRPNVVRRWVAQSGLTSVMVQYSLLDRRPEESILPLLQEKGIGVLARGALAQGLLLGKPPRAYLEHGEASVAAAAEAVAKASGSPHERTAAALGWVLHHPAVTSTVVGIRTPEQLAEVLQAVQVPHPAPDLLHRLGAAAPPLFYQQHR